MLNILTDELPVTVRVDGREHPVRWQYHHMIKVEVALHDPEIEENERLFNAMLIFYGGELPKDIQAAAEGMIAFLRYDKPLNRAQQREAKRNKHSPTLFCYDHDDELIFAAFMQHYGINLARTTDMHWYEFRALLSGLDECPFTRIKGWRGTELGKIKNAQERARMGELKELCALPNSAQVQQELDEIDRILLGDGDLSGFMGR